MARTLLIVDDEENVRNALKRSLRKEGYEFHTASGPEEALEILKRVPVDVVISDHMMPKITGIEFLSMVRDRYPDVGRIMLTGEADMNTAIRAINDGQIYRFLRKPWDDTEIKVILAFAFEKVEEERETRRLLANARKAAVEQASGTPAAPARSAEMTELEQAHPGISSVKRDESGAVILDEDDT